ncbi:MAG TPA: alginate lyase family protein [Terriglobales bacterium]|jgi:hypothetical protein|nr:alginate lyase family protein [Terriglobales bacterium]
MPTDRGLLDLGRRLTRMDADELRVRARQEACKRWDLLLAKVGWRFYQDIAPPSRPAGRFFFSRGDVPGILSYLRERLPGLPEQVVERAGRICRHQFDLLGYEGVQYGTPIDWHCDAVHGKRAPLRPWFRVPYLDFGQVGDAKVTWELSRHQHLVTLAMAYRFTGDDRYAAELFRQWYDWQAQNPYPFGINWASSLEVAFRSLSWLWVWHLLEGCPVVPPAFARHLRQALSVNARHIERYLSTYFSPNTHLLGEAVGLLFIGTLCPASARAQHWQQLGWRIVLREAQRQVQSDGMHFEQSLYYHVYALDFFLHARILAAANGLRVPVAFDQVLGRMLDVLAALQAAGPLPQTGDDDGGRVFDPQRNRREHLLDPLATGAVVFHRPELKTPRWPVHPEMVWLLGTGPVRRFDALRCARPEPRSFALQPSGMVVMSSPGEEEQRLLIDAGPQGASRAVHGHADTLSVQLAVGGKDVLVDAGTFAYADAEGGRNRFRETSSHNTVVVDGKSQAEPAGSFLWRSVADGKVESFVSGRTFDLFTGSHPGYARLAAPVVHRRSVLYLKPYCWLVRDVLEGSGAHLAEVNWHFAPGSLKRIPGGVWFAGKEQGAATFSYTASQDCSSEISPGWHSAVYGNKEPAPVFRVRCSARLPVEFAALLVPRSYLETLLAGLRALPRRGNVPVQGYRFHLDDRIHHVFFASAPASWRLGSCRSDARFAYYATALDGELCHYIVCDGSFLEIEGGRVFGSARPVAIKEHGAAAAAPVRNAGLSQPGGLRRPVATILQ